MPAILPSFPIDSTSLLSKYFMPHQINWIEAEEHIHSQNKQVFALAEKSIRIGWTHGDAFKNVRKRLRFRNRDYLFATKDYPSSLEYIRLAYEFAGFFNFTRAILSHGEEFMKVPRLDPSGHPTAFTDEIKIGVIKFDNGSRILAFSSHPQAMAVYGGDVGLDEFAKHPNAKVLWETAQGRITWGYDLAVWSSHDGEDTLFNEFCQEARRSQPQIEPQKSEISVSQSQIEIQKSKIVSPSQIEIQKSKIKNCWNLYYRVTMPDAIELGLLDTINRIQGSNFQPDQFLADCRARSREEEIFEQAYMCNPLGVTANHMVEWSAIERCRSDYAIERIHLEADEITLRFGDFVPYKQDARENAIREFLSQTFPALLEERTNLKVFRSGYREQPKFRLGFDVAASGQGDLAVFYIDEAKGPELWLQALLTVRTEDWHFLKTCLCFFLSHLSGIQAAGDETGLGRQICWEAAQKYPWRFASVNFASKKHDLGFGLMNQLAIAEKRFPRSEQDIAADYFALRKVFHGKKWVFSEGRNSSNALSHCDIAWAGALASHAHSVPRYSSGGRVA